jgi:uncharacterized membrane protein (DUF485 family)
VAVSGLDPEIVSIVRRRKRFLVTVSVTVLVLNFAMPLIAGLTTWLDAPALGPLPWAAVYGFGQLALFLLLANVYAMLSHRWSSQIAAVVAARPLETAAVAK